MTILAIEGAEGVGKTTVLRELHRLTGAPVIRPADYYQQCRNAMPLHEEADVWAAAIRRSLSRLAALTHAPLVLFDRLYLSTLVYQVPHALEQDDLRAALPHVLNVHTHTSSATTLYTVLICCGEVERHRRIQERGRGVASPPEVQSRYIEYYSRIPNDPTIAPLAGKFAITDSTSDDPETIAKEILSGLKIA